MQGLKIVRSSGAKVQRKCIYRPRLLRCAIALARHNTRQIYFTSINTCSPSAKKSKTFALVVIVVIPSATTWQWQQRVTSETNNDALLKCNSERHWLYFTCINILTNEITSLVQLLI
jgi:hypothetical protein